MTHRQRALAALRGEPVDRIPFIGRMELWFHHARNRGTLPERYRGWHLWDLQRDLDIGIFAFGAWSYSFYDYRHRTVEVREESRRGEKRTTFVTPHGDLSVCHRLSPELEDAEVQGLQTEWMLKSPRDYDALLYLIEDMEVVDNFDQYAALVDEVGEDGLAMPQTGYVPIHRLMHYYLGYETFYYELNDRPAQVERLHEALWAKQMEVMELAAQSPADAIEVGGNYDEHLTPPPLFERYVTPFYHEVKRRLEPAGKPLLTHGDGEMARLLTCLRDCGIDAVEALTPQPMTSIDLRSLRELWRDRVTLWGGIASIVLTPTYTQQAFEAHMDELFAAVAPGDRFILGFGDNVPTDGLFERVRQIADYARDSGTFPLQGVPFREAR